MATEVFLLEDGRIAFQSTAEKRNDINFLMKRNGGDFKENLKTVHGEILENAWVLQSNTARYCIKEIQEIDSCWPNDLVLGWTSMTDIELVRDRFNPDLFDPKNRFNKTFRGDYQREGVSRVVEQLRLALFWEMRLGKTPTVITGLNHHWAAGRFNRLLVVAPPESIYNFYEELEAWSTFWPGESGVYIADTKNRKPFQDHHRIVIITYRFLIALSDELYRKKMKKSSTEYRLKMLPTDLWGGPNEKRAIICDEFHLAKSPHGRTWKIMKMIREDFEIRYILTGTPAPQGTVDLWTQLTFLEPSCAHDTYSAFLKWMCETDAVDPRSDGNIVSYRKEREQQWLEETASLVSREKLKNRIEDKVKPYFTKLSANAQELYRELVKSDLISIQQKYGTITVKELENKYAHIQLVLDNPMILVKSLDEGRLEVSPSLEKKLRDWRFSQHHKLPLLESLIDRYRNEQGAKKIVVWSGHPLTLDLLGDFLVEKGLKVVIAHGQVEMLKGESTAMRSRRLVKDFWENDADILLASYLTLNSAIRLDIARHSIYFDRTWNWVWINQSYARINLPGVSEDIEINPLITLHTFEVGQHKRLQQHSDRNDTLYDPNHVLTKEELLDIFDGR